MLFEMTGDVGKPALAGSTSSDATGRYILTGGGANIWGTSDAFQFESKRVSGDLRLTARIKWQSRGKDPHRKAGLMVRQNRGSDSPYADAVIHGDGLISLQYRKTGRGPTEEVQSPIRSAQWLMLERHGDTFSMSVSEDGKSFTPVGSVSVPLKDPVEAGLIVCSHDDTVTETAVFTNVKCKHLGQTEVGKRMVESTLEIVSIETGQRRVVYRSPTNFEAPNWSRDGKTLLFNQGGKLYTIPVSGGKPETTRHRLCRSLQQRSRLLARRQADRHQPSHPARLADLHAARRRRHSATDYRQGPFLLARLVAGRQDAGLLRRAQRQLRCLYDPRRGRTRNPADRRRRPR